MEPIGFLFNWLISAQCFYYATQLKSHKGRKTTQYWKWFFILFGASTFFGGLSHLLFHYLGLTGKIPGWSLAILSMTALELAVFYQIRRSKFQWFVWIQTVFIFSLIIVDFKFLWVSIQTAIGLVLVVGLVSLFQIKKGDRTWSGYLMGIGWMLASIPFVVGEIDFSIWFNRHDVSHIFMMLTLWQFFRTTRLVKA